MDYLVDGPGRSNMGAIIFEWPALDPFEYQILASLYNPTTDAWIDTIYVDPRDRGNGYGSKMLTDFILECQRQGVSRIMGSFVNSPDSNTNVVSNWYSSHGFDIIEPVPGYQYIMFDLNH